MRTAMILILGIYSSFLLDAQSLFGAWETTITNENGDQFKRVVIFAENYQASSTYNAETGNFISTNGGAWQLNGNVLTETVEFHTLNPEQVGSKISFKVRVSDTQLEIVDSNITFNRIDDGTPGKLQGAWLMSGRIRNGETQSRDTNRPRKTMKILSGRRFQWIAYNTETKGFKGTGGGTYTTKDGEYVERIEFFSRDISRVGMSLNFNYELKDGNWYHSGKSSKGNPIHEIWSLRE